jgi:hypothetical protein
VLGAQLPDLLVWPQPGVEILTASAADEQAIADATVKTASGVFITEAGQVDLQQAQLGLEPDSSGQ